MHDGLIHEATPNDIILWNVGYVTNIPAFVHDRTLSWRDAKPTDIWNATSGATVALFALRIFDIWEDVLRRVKFRQRRSS